MPREFFVPVCVSRGNTTLSGMSVHKNFVLSDFVLLQGWERESSDSGLSCKTHIFLLTRVHLSHMCQLLRHGLESEVTDSEMSQT